MHVLEYLHRNVKTVAMPTAMVVGALLCRPVTALEGWTHQMITPSLIFLMLFVTFCRVKPRQMKPSMLHFWLLLFQVVVSVAVYFLLLPLNPIVAQGAMICVLAPVAMAAVVIAGMLGANVPTMATYSLVCNMVIALVAPVVLSLAGTGACSFTQILARIAPLLIISNAFMTLAWYGHIAFKSKLERFGMLAIVLLSWGIALFEYCFQVPANRIGSSQFGGPFSIWELKVIQEVVSLSVFTLFALVFMKSDSLRWNHLAGFLCLILAVYFIFRK